MRAGGKSDWNSRLALMALLAIAELVAIVFVYQVSASIECRLTEVETACRALRSMTARGLAMMAVMGLFFWVRDHTWHHLVARARQAPGRLLWLGVHIFGLTLIFLPLPLFGVDQINTRFAPTLALMVSGGLLTALGGLFWVTPAEHWRDWLRSDRYYLPLALLGGFLVPDLADLIRPVWDVSSLSEVTFFLVYLALSATGADVFVEPSIFGIGVADFRVRIASQCSGVEGIALITLFMVLYALLARDEIRQQRYWLVLYPLAILTSWVFNVLRIALLILIGANYSPQHALNGFHSYAGWLLFTVLALGVLAVAHRVRWFHGQSTRPSRQSTPIAREEVAAQIVPFIVMMTSGVIASTFWPVPADAYPLQAAMMAAVVVYFAPAMLSLWQRPHMVSAVIGAGVGLAWLATDTTPASTDQHGVPWIAARLIGTILLVPVIEELFFRGYILRRLARGSWLWVALALLFSSSLFGLLHERFVAGTAAGLVFGIVALRLGGLPSAIAAHITANAIVALWATIKGNWSMI